jgi:hypothetical protein
MVSPLIRIYVLFPIVYTVIDQKSSKSEKFKGEFSHLHWGMFFGVPSAKPQGGDRTKIYFPYEGST